MPKYSGPSCLSPRTYSRVRNRDIRARCLRLALCSRPQWSDRTFQIVRTNPQVGAANNRFPGRKPACLRGLRRAAWCRGEVGTRTVFGWKSARVCVGYCRAYWGGGFYQFWFARRYGCVKISSCDGSEPTASHLEFIGREQGQATCTRVVFTKSNTRFLGYFDPDDMDIYYKLIWFSWWNNRCISQNNIPRRAILTTSVVSKDKPPSPALGSVSLFSKWINLFLGYFGLIDIVLCNMNK